MKNKFIIVFAGSVGSSKTPIAFYLSYTFNLPMFNTDAIRSEVREDLLGYNVKEYKKRRDKRLKGIIDKGNSFILDASIDREWVNYKKLVDESNYKIFIISIDLSKDFLIKLFKAKNYEAIDKLDGWIKDHQDFLVQYGTIVNLHITDKNFKDRLQISSDAFKKWLKEF